MDTVILTTQTPHHAFFVQRFSEVCTVQLVIVETAERQAPFRTRHPYEDRQDAYENDTLLCGTDLGINDLAHTLEVTTANDPAAIAALGQIRPEMVMVFGTGKLGPGVLQTCPRGIVNLHGGDPEEYRGLDSDLWAIYHGDYQQLVVSLHRVNEQLDDGDIVSMAPIQLQRGMRLYQLRRAKTECCLDLALRAVAAYRCAGRLQARPQRRRGRYYSYMPAVLKEVCLAKFERFTKGL